MVSEMNCIGTSDLSNVKKDVPVLLTKLHLKSLSKFCLVLERCVGM
jgi:hypothetical protein